MPRAEHCLLYSLLEHKNKKLATPLMEEPGVEKNQEKKTLS